MADRIASENGRISNFEGPVTLTLDRVILHTVRRASLIDLYLHAISLKSKELFVDGQTDGRTFETGFIRSTQSKSRPKTINWPASVCDGRPAMRCSRSSEPCSHAAAETDCCWPSPVPHAKKLPPSAWRPSYDSNLQQ